MRHNPEETVFLLFNGTLVDRLRVAFYEGALSVVMALSFGPVKALEEVSVGKYPTIACPDCGAPTVAREDSVLCWSCIRSAEDWRRPLEEHIARYPKVLSFTRCTSCQLVLTSESTKQRRWGPADHESQELLALLLRKVRGALLGKRATSAIEGMSRALAGGELALEEARLVWTEPHSRRVRLEVVVTHKPALGSRMPSTAHRCEMEFVEDRQRCEACLGESRARVGRKMGGSGGGEFAAKIQIRAKRQDGGSGGKRTLRALEDCLHKTSANDKALALKRESHGFDVEFSSKQDAAKFLAEIRRLGRAPLKFADASKKLVTHDEHSNSSEWKRTTLISVPPIDKHDLVLIEDRALALVLAVRASIRLADITTKAERDVSADQYFRRPFDTLATAANMVRFVVTDKNVACRQDDERPRRFYAPFECKENRAYLGYDIDSLSHRIHLPPTMPLIVLVIPAPDDNRRQMDASSEVVKTIPSRKDRRKLNRRLHSASMLHEQHDSQQHISHAPPHTHVETAASAVGMQHREATVDSCNDTGHESPVVPSASQHAAIAGASREAADDSVDGDTVVSESP